MLLLYVCVCVDIYMQILERREDEKKEVTETQKENWYAGVEFWNALYFVLREIYKMDGEYDVFEDLNFSVQRDMFQLRCYIFHP